MGNRFTLVHMTTTKCPPVAVPAEMAAQLVDKNNLYKRFKKTPPLGQTTSEMHPHREIVF